MLECNARRQNAMAKPSRPAMPNMSSPASATPYVSGWLSLNLPATYADQVVMTEMAIRMITPGTMPKESKASGIDKTPKPISVFIMRTDAANLPT